MSHKTGTGEASLVLLEGRDLTREFPAGKGEVVHAVSDVSLCLREGETLGLVGESGCGKSTLGRMLLRLTDPTAGKIFFRGEDITELKERELRPFRRRMQMVFQDPYASLDPRMTVRDLIAEPIRTWKLCRTADETTERVLGLMAAVELQEEFLWRYPHQFSGGQRQRIGIARALATDPDLVICDEPVSALDVSVQNQILNLLRRLQGERNLTYLFISHDLSVVRHISDRVAVMFLGRICEIGPAERVFSRPLHPYTRFLISAAPKPDPHTRDEERPLLTGEMPSPVHPPSGCRFRTRCPYATDLCARETPLLRDLDGRLVACHAATGKGSS